MGWSLWRGHYCGPEDVRRGSCHCGVTWTRRERDHTAANGLGGRDIRNENGEHYPRI
jgi:hypothetical protein